METLNNCPVCTSSKIHHKFFCKDYVTSFESFGISECDVCNHQFTNPRPLETEIGKYYQSERYVSHAGESKKEMGLTYSTYDIVRNFNIKIKLNIIKKFHQHGKLLDLGCGLGYFLNQTYLDKTFEPVGVDISNEAISYIKKNFSYLTVYDETYLDKTDDNYFDIITQWHVLEHVYDLNKRIKQLKRILKKNGTLFIAVPNQGSWDARYYKTFWDGYDVPRHIHHFSKKSFLHLIDKNNLMLVDIKPMYFDAPYVCMRSEQHQQHAFSFIKGAFFGMISTFSALFNGEYSSLMFIVKNK